MSTLSNIYLLRRNADGSFSEVPANDFQFAFSNSGIVSLSSESVVSGIGSIVLGGLKNKSIGKEYTDSYRPATVIGGEQLTASGDNVMAIGGKYNTSYCNSSIVGGIRNTGQKYSLIIGGENNFSDGNADFTIIGGISNSWKCC